MQVSLGNQTRTACDYKKTTQGRLICLLSTVTMGFIDQSFPLKAYSSVNNLPDLTGQVLYYPTFHVVQAGL
jgi:hypothetical protein